VNRRAWPAAALILTALAPGVAHAQRPPFGQPTGRPGEPPPLSEEQPRPAPPTPILPPLPPSPTREREPLPRERVFVHEIRVVGNTVLSPQEIADVVSPYVDRELTSEDLEALRVALTVLYINKGYVNSGAVLPDQTVTEGVVTYQIVEGRLTGVDVEGNRWFRAGYLQRRLRLAAGPPLNVNALQQELQFLLEDPRFQRLNADLKPGVEPGEARLDVHVQERLPYRLTLQIDNYQPPAIGAERGLVTLEHENLTGNGDVLTLQWGVSQGVNLLEDFKYSLPFTARDTTASFEYRRDRSTVVQQQFERLDIESDSEIFTLTLRQPLYRTLTDEVAVELIGERSSDTTTLLDRPFPLSPGASSSGRSIVAVLRSVQEWIHRTSTQVIGVRSRFSLGVDALGATINSHSSNIPDSRFFAWLGQFQWVRQLPFLDTVVLYRTDLQLAANPLLILEQMAVGGRYSVRGYEEDTLLRDNAFLTSLEVRVPLVRHTRWADYLELAPFTDFGRAWDTARRTPDPQDLASVGIGLRWAATVPLVIPLRPVLEVYWGHKLRDVTYPGGNLQDKGVHFQILLTAF